MQAEPHSSCQQFSCLCRHKFNLKTPLQKGCKLEVCQPRVNGSFSLKTETDPNGGGDYAVTSVQQLLSVPYALFARDAGNGFSGDYNDLTNKPAIPQSVGELTLDANYITMDSVPNILD